MSLNPISIPQLSPIQSHAQPPRSLHVAIISDGNGRWASSRGLPRSAGHRQGAEAARAVIQAAPRLGIHTLTLFALSSANWKRPAAEVSAILRLLHEYLLTETSHCIDEGVRLSIIGRRDRLPATLRQTIADSEAATARGTRLHLRLAVDYSARHAIYSAACRFYKVTELSQEAFGAVLSEVLRGGSTDVDLLVRTGAISASPTSSSGNAPSPNSSSSPSVGPTSPPPTWNSPSANSITANAPAARLPETDAIAG